MLILPVGKNKPHLAPKQAGFTMVEVLAVLLIFGLMAGAVVMNLPAKPDPLHERGRLMASHFQLAAQTALINHQAVGIRLIEQSYEFVRFNGEEWEVMQKFDIDLTPKPILELTQNAAKIDLELAEKSGIPLIRYDTTGLGTPFKLSLDNGVSHMVLTGTIDGLVTTEIKP